MIAFLIGLAPYIPIILQVVGWLIKMFGTSEENLKLYGEMIQKNKDLGRVSVETARIHDEMYEKLKARAQARKAAESKEKQS
jgi:hypothetical protein